MEKGKLEAAIEKAMQLAWGYEQKYGGCAQVVLASVRETVGNISDEVFQSATGLAGGVARTGNACGALTGGVMALSCFWGRPYDDFADPDKRRVRTFSISKKLADKFQEAYGSPNCGKIQEKIMGRSYDLGDPKDFEQFVKDGGHDDKCPSVCANAARWTLEILNEEGLI
ncbi:MAG: C-GCAxxG-C-C family protein [Synergistaceae bacterium]|nr:C-GCAxxG-C-C family protein [Synergistaceae bacterium]